MDSKILVVVFGSLLALSLLGEVMAITGSIGNARMIIQATTGEEIEKYVLVKNVNDAPVDINITASGGLADRIEIKEKQFRLNAGEEKQAYFTIKALKPGTTETQINVAFTPQNGSGVGLSSTVIVVAKGEEVQDSEENDNNADNDPSNITGAFAASPVLIGLLSTTVILALFIILLAVYSQKVKKKKEIIKKRETKPKKKSETE